MDHPATAPNKKPWLVYTLVFTLIAFVLVDLLLIVTGTRVLANALQPPPPAPTMTAGQAKELLCRYFTGTGLELVTIKTDGGAIECPLVLPAGEGT